MRSSWDSLDRNAYDSILVLSLVLNSMLALSMTEGRHCRASDDRPSRLYRLSGTVDPAEMIRAAGLWGHAPVYPAIRIGARHWLFTHRSFCRVVDEKSKVQE
jgi:hypothetical protein